MNKFFLFYILTILLLSGCNVPDSSNNTSSDSTTFIPKLADTSVLNLTKTTGIEFDYILGSTKKIGKNTLMDIECFVFNKTNQQINYLCQTGYELELSLVIKPETIKVIPLALYFATGPKISRISPGDTINFKTQLLIEDGSKPIEKIGLDFRVVDNYVSVDLIRQHPILVKEIYESQTNIDNVIWSNQYYQDQQI